ncbi:hypothetical protein BDB01DRAFT_831622 [Pilobolus umbonatus]|nr:hypothetical protein BDB01DRAFT_831622 [Pilobolus umbonatus]
MTAAEGTLRDSTQLDSPLFWSDDYEEQELARLQELQQRHIDLINKNIEDALISDDEEDRLSSLRERKAPAIPEMRYEKQFDNAVQHLQESGVSTGAIIWSVVIKDQMIVPFISGFTWCLGTSAWKWYRLHGRIVKSSDNKKTGGFFSWINRTVIGSFK